MSKAIVVVVVVVVVAAPVAAATAAAAAAAGELSEKPLAKVACVEHTQRMHHTTLKDALLWSLSGCVCE